MTTFTRYCLVALALVAAPVSANKQELDEFQAWLESLAIDPGVNDQIVKFSHKDTALDKTFAESFSTGVRQLVVRFSNTWVRLLAGGKTSPFIQVNYPDPGFAEPQLRPPESKVAQKFEGSFVRTEVISVVEAPGVSPKQALYEYTKPAFRQQVSSTLKAITQQDGLSCVETKEVKVVLAPTLACNKITEFHRPGLAAQHSQVVTNPGGDDFQPVYYKESLKIFVEVPEGLALYYINYARTTDLGRMSKYVGQKQITQSQKEAVIALEQVLNP